MKHASLFTRKFLVAVGLVLSVPTIMTGLFGLQEDAVTLPGLLRSDIMEHQSQYRAQRRAYTRKVNRCRRLMQGDEVPEACQGIDINDPSSYMEGGEGSDKELQSAPTPLPAVTEPPMREPTEAERRLLRAYRRAGYCSKAAGQFVYDLCRVQLKPRTRHGSAPRGFLNDNIQLHSANRVYIPLRERLRARYMQTNETLREEFRGPRPMRYEGGLNYGK